VEGKRIREIASRSSHTCKDDHLGLLRLRKKGGRTLRKKVAGDKENGIARLSACFIKEGLRGGLFDKRRTNYNRKGRYKRDVGDMAISENQLNSTLFKSLLLRESGSDFKVGGLRGR